MHFLHFFTLHDNTDDIYGERGAQYDSDVITTKQGHDGEYGPHSCKTKHQLMVALNLLIFEVLFLGETYILAVLLILIDILLRNVKSRACNIDIFIPKFFLEVFGSGLN